MVNKGRKHVVSFLEYNIFSKQVVFLLYSLLISYTHNGDDTH